MNEFNYDDSAYLAHHGVKGMHWGVRKDKSAYRTSSNIKQFIRRNGKKIAIGAGAATIGAAALGAGLGLATSQKARQNRYENRAHKNYQKQQGIIERIENQRYTPTPRANYKRQQGIIERIENQRYTPTPRANYKRQQGIIEGIKNNPNANVQTTNSESYKRMMARQAKK
jgi:hypothetical protein